MGLVQRSCEPGRELDAALDYARDLVARCSPASMAAVKQQVTRHAVMTLPDSEVETVAMVDESLEGPDLTEGVRSFVERRPAQFAPLGEGTVLTPLGDPVSEPVGAQTVRSPAAAAEAFFAATQANDWAAARAAFAPGARLASHPGPPEASVEEASVGWQRIRDGFGPWEYRNVRRLTSPGAFCEQHAVWFPDLGVELEACVVAAVDTQGRITRLEEYVDGGALRTARAARRTAEPATAP